MQPSNTNQHHSTRRTPSSKSKQPSRRAVLSQGALVVGALGTFNSLAWSATRPDDSKPQAKLGMMTDMHYADKDAGGSRHYRETLAKIDEAARELKDTSIDAVIELGDFIDSAPTIDKELQHLDTIQTRFSSIHSRRYHVLGNHCVHTLEKPEFLKAVGQDNSYGSFDLGDFHAIYLDACFRSDGAAYGRKNFDWTDPNISADQLKWLADDLSQHQQAPVLVFVHQRLDVGAPYGIKNATAVRELLKRHANVAAVFQGHSHKNELKVIDEIPYCTLAAMVEGSGVEKNAYSILSLYPDHSLRLDGFRQQTSRGPMDWNSTPDKLPNNSP